MSEHEEDYVSFLNEICHCNEIKMPKFTYKLINTGIIKFSCSVKLLKFKIKSRTFGNKKEAKKEASKKLVLAMIDDKDFNIPEHILKTLSIEIKLEKEERRGREELETNNSSKEKKEKKEVGANDSSKEKPKESLTNLNIFSFFNKNLEVSKKLYEVAMKKQHVNLIFFYVEKEKIDNNIEILNQHERITLIRLENGSDENLQLDIIFNLKNIFLDSQKNNITNINIFNFENIFNSSIKNMVNRNLNNSEEYRNNFYILHEIYSELELYNILIKY